MSIRATVLLLAALSMSASTSNSLAQAAETTRPSATVSTETFASQTAEVNGATLHYVRGSHSSSRSLPWTFPEFAARHRRPVGTKLPTWRLKSMLLRMH
jgi:hypothetical protein